MMKSLHSLCLSYPACLKAQTQQQGMSHRGTARASRMMRADEKRHEIEHKANTIENASTNLGGYVTLCLAME